MSKTLTTYEALKANETKRVRPVGTNGWWGQGALIDCINRGAYSLSVKDWEVDELLRELWIVELSDGTFVRRCSSYEEAKLFVYSMTDAARIVHMREVRP